MGLTPSTLRNDKRCGRSGIPDNRKCSKTTPQIEPDKPTKTQASNSNSALTGVLVAAGISTAAYIALRERYRGNVAAAASDALRRSKSVDTTLRARQKRIVFCVPGASGSESIQRGEGIQAAWQKSLSPERNKKDEKTIMVDTRKANLDPRDSADANPQEIMAMHLKNQVRGRNEAAVDLASQIIAFRKAHPDKQIVIVGHSYGGAISEEALAIVSRTKTKTQNIVSINLGTNNYGLLDGMISKDIKQVTLGSPKDPFTANGPTKQLRNITTVKGHSLRDYSSDRQVQNFVRNLVKDRAPLMRRDVVSTVLTSSSVRSDFLMALSGGKGKPCGEGWISRNLNCGNSGVNRAYEASKSTQGRLKAEAFNALLLGNKSQIIKREKGTTLHASKHPVTKANAYQAVFNIRDKVGLLIAGEITNPDNRLKTIGVLKKGSKIFNVQFQLGGSLNAAQVSGLSKKHKLKAVLSTRAAFAELVKKLPEGTILQASAYDTDNNKQTNKDSFYRKVGFTSLDGGSTLFARVGKEGIIDAKFNFQKELDKFNETQRKEAQEKEKVARAERQRYNSLSEEQKAAELQRLIEEQNKALEELRRQNRRRRDADQMASRLDKKCGASGIPENAKCTKGGSWPQAATIGAALTAGGIAAFALSRGSNSSSTSSTPTSPSVPPQLPGLSPRALFSSGGPRKSKTQRMRENTAAAMRNAEGRIAQTAREEVRRVAQIGNTMAAAGEATGMAAKTTMRELRLRTEAARRRFEPGYRSPDKGKVPAQLPQGGGLPVNTNRAPSKAPDTLEGWAALASNPEGFRNAMRDPATGQPRRRRAQGFGRTDNYIQYYAPTQLQPPTRRDACRVPNCVPTKKRAQADTEDGKKYSKTVTNPETGRKNKVRYGAKGYRIAPGTDKGDNYCARSFGDMKSEGYDCSGAERNTPLCLSRAKWKCSGKTSRRDGLTPGKLSA